MDNVQTQQSVQQVDTNDSTRLFVDNVAKTYVTHRVWPLVKKNQVLINASLEASSGDIVALVGANGSGKSTLMMIIAGVLSRDSGTIQVNGRIGYCPQYPVLYEKLTVDETCRLFGAAYGMSYEEIEYRSNMLMENLDFAHYRDYRIEHLSGGTKQKLNVAIALLHDPELLLLDEPYSGFDYETYVRFWEMSKEIATKGHSILVISHFVEDRERFDRIYQLKDGRCEREL